MTLSIPKEKVDELLRKLPVIYLASTISCQHLQSVLALMSFVRLDISCDVQQGPGFE